MSILWQNFGFSSARKRVYRISSKGIVFILFIGISIAVYYLKRVRIEFSLNDKRFEIISTIIPFVVALLNILAQIIIV
jgi:hypothetical protein